MFGKFWDHSGSILGHFWNNPMIRLKKKKKKILIFQFFLQNCPKNIPKTFQTFSKNFQNVPKMFQKCPKMLPEWSQNFPKISKNFQKFSKIFKNFQKKIKKSPKIVQNMTKKLNILIKNTSGRSLPEVFFNLLHPVKKNKESRTDQISLATGAIRCLSLAKKRRRWYEKFWSRPKIPDQSPDQPGKAPKSSIPIYE